MISGIYKITNIINGKCYIGSSSNLKERIRTHRTTLKCGRHDNRHLQRSYNKYGKDNFDYEILFTCPITELVRIEQYFIDNYSPEYNILKKAYTTFGFKHSDESKRKMSEIQKSINRDMKSIAKISAKARSKAVLQYDLEGNFIKEWENAKIAAKALNLHSANISFCCRNPVRKKRKGIVNSGGFVWKYK